MPTIATYDRLIEIIRKSGLVSEAKFNQFLSQYQATGGEEEPTPLATRLVRDGLVTTFQAKQLLQGRWRRFVINNKYKVLDLLGQGGMGAVYLCEHTMMRRLVALKVLPEDKLQQPGALERFQREARAVATLDHPNIVHAYDMDRDDNNMHFMVMEYVDGLSLEIILSKFYKGVGIDAIRAAHYISQAALGLQHAHECNWVHRDIKPANLLLDRQGIVKLLDLGLSRLYAGDEEELTKKYDGGSVLGTADYIAPEQALNVSGVDIRADIYGLGATFYFLLAGHPPFEKGTVTQKLMYHQTREPESITKKRSDVPLEMEAVIRTMMAKNPDDRYPNPAAVVEALAPWTQMPIPPPADKECPNHCPLIRELLPTATASGRSSGSWNLKAMQSSLNTPPLLKIPVNTPVTPIHLGGATPSGRFSPPAGGSGRQVETVVDQSGRQAVTPKSLPKVPKQPAVRGNATPPAEKSDRNLYLYITIGAVAFLCVTLGVFAYIFVLAFSDDTSKPLGTNRQAGSRPAFPSNPEPAPTQPAPPDDKPAPPVNDAPPSGLPTVTPAEAASHMGKQVLLRLAVKSTGGTTTRSFLNSEKNHRDDANFAIVMSKDIEQALLARLKVGNLNDLVGKTLSITGKVAEFQGKAQMVLDRAEQVSLAD